MALGLLCEWWWRCPNDPPSRRRSSACRRFATRLADVRLETDARVVRRTDAPRERDSVRSSGELARAPTRTAAVVQPARRRRRARRGLHRRRRRHRVRPGHPRRRRRDRGRLPGTRSRSLVAHRARRRARRSPSAGAAPLPALAISSVGDPRPLPRRLARGLPPARRAVPHLHRRARGARCGRRSPGSASWRRRSSCSGSPTRPGSTRVGALGVLAQFAAVWAIGVADAQPSRARPTRGSARPRSGPRPSARARRGCSPRSGCGSPRSCTTSSPTRCR